ncbi:hypothetical protein CEUSTIGMA_g11710.t1 [Chlamydomonas eustigma]|uniref:DNA repair protein RAD51 homolog 3 n=1 Tax=Chlamydomonas eustigma TaxID=1157962 RepID=A0A250XMI9_9CHLO|nr:hypothetical protein CEUSTIGMA_g11710.t1 [Chlamydomonas eustigma]|eukprot:GAX84288.1 hypothetical protein CEUSTIGMA_g11710.t1 [Chlamydomonas eustigma]
MRNVGPAPRQEVISLPLEPDIKGKLFSRGLRTLPDIDFHVPSSLVTEAQINTEEAVEILQVCSSMHQGSWRDVGAVSALDILHSQRGAQRVSTSCYELDRILGGGVMCGEVTEFCGVPGIGKTQLGMQLAVNVQIPTTLGGLRRKPVYIDTEGSFMVERLHDIASASVRGYNHKMRALHIDPSRAQEISVEEILDRIHYFRIHDSAEQVSLVAMLERFLQADPEVGIIIVDSVTFHFRQDFRDLAHRTRVLTKMAQDFMAVAERHSIAVVFMNQVTTKVQEGLESRLIPALGDSWGHAASTRVILYWQDDSRYAHVYKSPCQQAQKAQYLVSTDGVRDIAPRLTEKRARDLIN